jgi:hypothetical protein
MIVKLQPTQITAFWEAIRLAYMEAQNITVEKQGAAAVFLLQGLLSGKLSCWVIYAEEKEGRHIHAVAITSISQNMAHGNRHVLVEAIYGFRKLSDELATEGIQKLTEFARANDCQVIIAGTSSGRIKELAELTGFAKSHEVYELKV